ncbi:phosphoribosyl-ATP diphosphatase [candidate division KSB3 bacterium]|uniref:Histidine biosynthesis bifunctional protein HisIE n=1 Tax=candidate division KSB3 bacterium TaxID=2044937 RepID=A0A2G6KJD6_9BACT|nr:MAG: phosphoribosyl-ATP diphosphatase [candidate division KSB3 bacterium]
MVVASIDIMQGKVVQLKQGQEKVLERNDAVALAKEFDRFGEIAVIDLDAAMGKGENVRLVQELLKYGECRVGGGIRTVERAKELVSLGAKKVIIGSQAFENNGINHSFLQDLVSVVDQSRIMIAVDSLNRRIVTRGWKHQTDISLQEAVEELELYASEFLFTCVEREGTMKGADFDQIRELKEATNRQVTVAGGIATLDEVAETAKLGTDVQLGMALYTGKIDLVDAFVECLDWEKAELMPTITQDENGQVLMMAYSTRETLKKAFETGKMTYCSRSHQQLCTKGEASDHVQKLIRMRADCDRDAILVTVKQSGPACHNETYSCFGDRKFSLQELYAVLDERVRANAPGAYMTSLTDESLRETISKEAQELIEARTKDEIIREAADVLYFTTALLAQEGGHIEDVFAELARRRQK